MAKPASPSWNPSGVGGANCVAYYLLHEGSGAPTDISGNARDTSLTGSLTWGTGALGAKLSGFSGSNYLTASLAGAGFDFSTYPWAVAVCGTQASVSTRKWISWNQGSYNEFGSLGTEPNAFGFVQYGANGGYAEWYDTSYVDLSAGGTIHVLMLVATSATDRKLYRNGVQVGSDTTNLAPTAARNSLVLGALDIGTGSKSDGMDGDLVAAALWVGGYPAPADLDADWRGDVWSAARGGATPPVHLILPAWRSPYPIVES